MESYPHNSWTGRRYPLGTFGSFRSKRSEPLDFASRSRNTSLGLMADPDDLLVGLTTSYPENVTSFSRNSTDSATYDFFKIGQLAFLYLMIVIIIAGNVSVLVAIALSKKRKSRMNFFIMQLAIADLACGLVIVPIQIVWKTTEAWYAGVQMCKILRYLESVATFGSTYVLVALSIDRLDAIAKPMNFTGSGKRARILVSVAWALSFLFSVQMLVLCKIVPTKQGDPQCKVMMPREFRNAWKVYVTLLFFLLFIIPAIIIGSCYSVIISVIWRKRSVTSRTTTSNGHGHGSRQTPRSQDSQTSGRGLIPKARIKTVKMTLVIVFAFVFCWSPYFIFNMLSVYGRLPRVDSMKAISIFMQDLSILNSAANPLIYCLFSTRICQNWRRFALCDWLAVRLCCSEEQPVNGRRPGSITNGTDFTTVVTDGRCLLKPALATGGHARRHSGTPYVKSTLTQRDNEILLRHLSSSGDNNVVTSASSASGGDVSDVSQNVVSAV